MNQVNIENTKCYCATYSVVIFCYDMNIDYKLNSQEKYSKNNSTTVNVLARTWFIQYFCF